VFKRIEHCKVVYADSYETAIDTAINDEQSWEPNHKEYHAKELKNDNPTPYLPLET
jgi:hypothetical protein